MDWAGAGMENHMRLFKKNSSAKVEDSPPCVHGVLVPRWDDANDMGDESKATQYLCEACGQMLSPTAAREAKVAEIARLSRN